MKNNKKVSIIVPVFNVEKYLPECIESILNQSYNEFELILVDDGSTDGSGIICDNYMSRDLRVKVIHKQNGGVSDARNIGLKEANGYYIAFVDADDLLDKDYLLTMIEHINGCQMAMCYFKSFKDGEPVQNADSIKTIVVDETGFWKQNYGLGFKASVCNKLFESSLFKNLMFDINFNSGEDDLIIHQITSQCKKIVIIQNFLYFYRTRCDSLTHTRKQESVLPLRLSVYIERCLLYLKNNNKELFDKWYFTSLDLLLKNYYKGNLKKERKRLKNIFKIKKQKYNDASKTEKLFFFNASLYYFLLRLKRMHRIR